MRDEFRSQQKTNEQSSARPAQSSPLAPPSLSLPKGGGALRGIGEKFAANPVTGTGAMTIPLAVSPGRGGFAPQLALAYDSGAGNGPFGLGWHLGLPAITRKTDKGLPKYQDAAESDVFILSGAEDLVPELMLVNEEWERRQAPPRTMAGRTYAIQRYRPRTEGLFARIERWTATESGETCWRSISKENITTWYGKTAESRVADPLDSSKVFSWLICESYDDKGNAILYRYKPEDTTGVALTQANEKNRTNETRRVNRHLKSIGYCNQTPRQPDEDLSQRTDWLMEIVFDYGEHAADNPRPNDQGDWLCRTDSFSSYRSGFEVRTYRLCQRVLVFHHFAAEDGVGRDCLVRSTDFSYQHNHIASFIRAVAQTGYQRRGNGYLKQSLPPLEFTYTAARISDEVHIVDAASLENLPAGLDGARYQWVDLDGEGVTGILTEQGTGWFYKRNLSPLTTRRETVVQNSNTEERVVTTAAFAPAKLIRQQPSLAALNSGAQQFLDLAGDGLTDLVQFNRPLSGFYERTPDGAWSSFVPFAAPPVIAWDDPNLKFIDLTGDGHADVLITEDEVFTWYPSLAETGFGPAARVRQAVDEEKGPRLVFADGTHSVYLADMSGDGLTDLVRIGNGAVCYWPNLGYGRFGAKVTMDDAPWLDAPDQFEQRRIRLADIDGSGVTDIIYLGSAGIQLYFNQSGNSWSALRRLNHFPRTDNLSSVLAVDLLGNGTACLVWSSPLPGAAQQAMRYIDLMGGQKPHLLIATKNNLGAETRVHYAPSTKFYLADKLAGQPWCSRLPFPVHVVERVETIDHLSRNRFVTRYAYHHGYFDGFEREFRGFGMVEQFDTETFAALNQSDALPAAINIDVATHVPPVLIKTWFHTGVFIGRDHVSNFFAGLLNDADAGEYFREPGLTDAQAQRLLLPDTHLPDGLSSEEEREACRALKGAMLRQEVYALDGTNKEQIPYAVTEQNFTVETVQPRLDNRHAVFFTHAREAISYHYERNPADPRVTHALTLEVDLYGNVLKSATVGYGRRTAASDPLLNNGDRARQTTPLLTFTENSFTNLVDEADHYRTPLPSEARIWELLNVAPDAPLSNPPLTRLLGFAELSQKIAAASDGSHDLPYEDVQHTGATPANVPFRRLIEDVRTLYRRDDLTALLPLNTIALLALPGESYKLALTPGLLASVFIRAGQPPEDLLPVPAPLLEGRGFDQGGYLALDGAWWIPSGRVFFDAAANVANPHLTAAQELITARQNFFQPQKFADPFDHSTTVVHDDYHLLAVRTQDALGNVVAAANDYRVLQPRLITDANRNRSAAAFDALGMVVATAVMGKDSENLGDRLDDFTEDDANPTLAQLQNFMTDPRSNAAGLLKNATARIVYDLDRYRRAGQPPFAATLARETHANEPPPIGGLKIQISFTYSDGFGREIQKKIQAEPGRLAPDDPTAPVVNPRWVGGGWTIFNNKGKPVRQYEPFFDDTHDFKFAPLVGVSATLFYDPIARVVATLHPNHTWEKVVFDPWRQERWDVNDTVLIPDPKQDPDIGDFFRRLPDTEYLPTWHAQRQGGALGPQEQLAAAKTAIHAATPTIAYLDALGRSFLTIAHNKFKYSNTPPAAPPSEDFYRTRVTFDIEGNQREVRDERMNSLNVLEERIVMSYDYDLLGNRIRQSSLEAGARWMLNDVAGKPIRAWDSRAHTFRTAYDPLRRPLRFFVSGADPANLHQELLIERLIYGEQHPEDLLLNLRGRVFMHCDQAGVAINESQDFKGNLLRASRRLAKEYKRTVDWSAADAALPADPTAPLDPAVLETAIAPLLAAETFTSRTAYDALNRPILLTSPHTAAMSPSLIRPAYNEANLLERVEANLRDAQQNGQPVWTPFVANIDYDAKGQRTQIDYGNGVRTVYDYDPLTFRLIHLQTVRNATDFPDDCPQPSPAGWPGCAVQNLHYTYDPAGNITHIRDDAQQTIYFRNQRVEPSAQYTYDAVNRLIEATGREHLGQAGGAPLPHSHNDAPRVGIAWSANDGNAMGTYVERYVYDAVGNILSMQHRGSDPAHPGWTRAYEYNEASLIEPAKQSNRLSRAPLASDPPSTASHFDYDAHGNMTRITHLPLMEWDYRDQLQATAQQVVNNGTPETTWYVYDAGGQRVCLVTESMAAAGQTPTRMKERIYLGGFEIYREFENDGDTVKLERETLHIMDDKQRIALVEARTQGNDPAPPQLIRYQFSNHLGSASLELDQQAQIISYEEYTPYGSTSYQAVRSHTETPKRYRYTGKERDEETGLNYHGARYYATWLGRWISSDPAGLVDGVNLYQYSTSNPIVFVDATGTEPKRTYQLGLGFEGSDFRWNPLTDAEANTNVTQLILGGIGKTPKLLSDDPKWPVYIGVFAAQFYFTVFSHEGGHYREGVRQNVDPELKRTLGFIPTGVSGRGISNQALFMAAGSNQNTLNARQIFEAQELSGGSPTLSERFARWQNEAYLFSYALRGVIGIGDTDIANYTSATGATRGGIFAASATTLGLTILSDVFSEQIEGLFANRIAAPRFQTFLTTSGDPLIGVQTILRARGRQPAFEVGLDLTPTSSNFALSLGIKAHDITIPGLSNLSASPFASFSDSGLSGISAGIDVRYRINDWLGVSGRVGYRGENPLNEIEGVATGWHGRLAGELTF